VEQSNENKLRGFPDEPAWQAPLVGFAAGDDPLFSFLKEDVGPFYWTPSEAFAFSSGAELPGSRLSVVSWVLPQTEATKADQRDATRFPAKRWMASRAYWSEFTRDVHTRVIASLEGLGIQAVAPEMLPEWGPQTSNKYGHACNWSHRHTAYIAGLGTFGLSDGLITRAGVAMRAGSVVANCAVEPTERDYSTPFAWCPFVMSGECGECIRRCPVGAISSEGHDKDRCERYVFETLAHRTGPELGERSGGCGLCQAGVRCESGVPLPR
jgi:epoxyqueuosine reductase QueG